LKGDFMNVYELTNTFNTLWNLIEDESADDDILLDAFENATDDLKDKLENCCKYIRNQEAVIKGLKEEEDRINKKRKALENGNTRLKALMQKAIEASGETKIPCGTFTCSVQKNPASLVLDVETAYIPSKYLIPQAPKVDTAMLKEDIKNGVSGLSEIAHLEQKSGLRIK